MWQTCQNVHTGPASDLEDIARTLDRIMEKPPDSAGVAPFGRGDSRFDLQQLSAEAPTPEFFEVCKGKTFFFEMDSDSKIDLPSP